MLKSMGRSDTPEEIMSLANEGYRLVQGKMYENLMGIMLSRKYPDEFENGIDQQIEYLIRRSWENHDKQADMLFNSNFFTNSTLVGIGAPTHVFLPEVAKAFKTKCILPEHAEVANALGALKADINAVVRVNITQRNSLSSGNVYYIVHSPSGSMRIDDFDEAVAWAKDEASKAAIREARARGAVGELKADTSLVRHKAVSRWGAGVEMGATVLSEVEVRLS
jgi:N-methylhydantoinase A/oxoprolinase/acetone carboxylase beta subunit